MLDFLKIALATAFANTISFLIYQGFVKSAIGKQFREEISRWWNQLYSIIRRKK